MQLGTQNCWLWKNAVKELHASSYSKVCLKTQDYKQKLAQIQAHPDINHNGELQAEEREYYKQLRARIDDSILKQKSRINWIFHGDTNSKLFFTAGKVRKARNNIILLYNEEGEMLKMFKVHWLGWWLHDP